MNGTPDEELQPMPEQVAAERMTQTEAEEVIALWARLQEQRHAESGLPSVTELAEVLGTDTGHVQSLLNQVRSAKESEDVRESAIQGVRKKGRRVWVWCGAGLGVLTVVALGVYMIMATWMSAVPAVDVVSATPAPIAKVSESFAPRAEIAVPVSADATKLVQGVSVTLDGMQVKGRLEKANPNKDLVEQGVMESFRALYEGIQYESASSRTYSAQDTLDALSASKSLSGVFRFVTAQVSVQGKTHSVAVPISETRDANLKALIENESNARLESLAKWATENMKATEFKMVSN